MSHSVSRSLLGLAVLALAAALGGCAQETAAIEALQLAATPALHDGERFEYVLVEGGRELARGTLTAERAADGWVLTQRYEAGAARDSSEAAVDEALRPASSSRAIERDDGSVEAYAIEYRSADERFVSTVTKGGADETREFRLRENAYDNESSFWLWRSLPLGEGYAARYVSVNPYERSQQTVELRVVGRGEVTVPAGAFDAWRLQVLNGRATRTAWIEVAPPHRLLQWDNGSSLLQLVR